MLPSCGITEKELEMLSLMLLERNKLISLNVQDNDCSEGVGALFYVLKERNTSLTKLNLSNIGIIWTLEDARKLQQTLETNTSLTLLNLSNNDWLKDKHGVYIAKGLKKNTTLTSLSLRETRVTNVTCFEENLRHNTTLTNLEMEPNVIEANVVLKLWKRNTNLLYISTHTLGLYEDVEEEMDWEGDRRTNVLESKVECALCFVSVLRCLLFSWLCL